LSDLASELPQVSMIDSDKVRHSILYITNPNWWSWGTNIYLTLEAVNNEQTKVTISTVALQVINWNENEKILVRFLTVIDNKLTI
jgi:hypothetical protein